MVCVPGHRRQKKQTAFGSFLASLDLLAKPKFGTICRLNLGTFAIIILPNSVPNLSILTINIHPQSASLPPLAIPSSCYLIPTRNRTATQQLEVASLPSAIESPEFSTRRNQLEIAIAPSPWHPRSFRRRLRPSRTLQALPNPSRPRRRRPRLKQSAPNHLSPQPL